MAERNLSVDHVTIWRWVQRYAPILNQRIRRELRRPNRSWRVDETYIKIAGNWAYLYRAVDSAGETIEFMLSPKRDLIAAKLFLRLALSAGGPSSRVINMDGHPAYPSAVAELKQSGELGRRCRCRTARYLNNVIEQDHGFIKKRVATLWLQRLHDWALWYCTVAPQPHRGCRSRASRDEGPHCRLDSTGEWFSLESQPVASEFSGMSSGRFELRRPPSLAGTLRGSR